VKPEEKADRQEPQIVKPSPATPAHETRSQSDPQPDSAGNRLDATPAVLRSDTPASGSVVQQVVPDVPQTASDTIQGTLKVSVRIKVDAAGEVRVADLVSQGPSKYFARLSLEAAQRWKFAPSSENGGREFVVHFEFRNTGTRAYATRAGG
jgi:TonB family protein